MRNTLQRRPGFEALESMTLLSGLAGAVGATAAPNPSLIHLTGSIRIQVTRQAIIQQFKHHLPAPPEKGSGSISPIGHVTGSGLDLMSLALANSASLTLAAKTGKIIVAISGVTDAGTGFAGEYTIAGGTKAYAGATGSGNILITFPIRGKFTAILS